MRQTHKRNGFIKMTRYTDNKRMNSFRFSKDIEKLLTKLQAELQQINGTFVSKADVIELLLRHANILGLKAIKRKLED